VIVLVNRRANAL